VTRRAGGEATRLAGHRITVYRKQTTGSRTGHQSQCSPSVFFAHDSHAPISVLALGGRGSPVTLGEERRKHLRSVLRRQSSYWLRPTSIAFSRPWPAP
jgi:hypothetical protein